MDQFLQVLILFDLKLCWPVLLTVVLSRTKTILDERESMCLVYDLDYNLFLCDDMD